jgi:hypothetical protein
MAVITNYWVGHQVHRDRAHKLTWIGHFAWNCFLELGYSTRHIFSLSLLRASIFIFKY